MVSSAKPKDHDLPEKSCDWTYRNVSQMLGISLWDLRVRDVSPLEYTDLLTVYSKVTPPEGKERDDLINLPADEVAAVKKYMDQAAQHLHATVWKPWTPSGKIATYAVDASGKDPRFVDDKSPAQVAIVSIPVVDASVDISATQPDANSEPTDVTRKDLAELRTAEEHDNPTEERLAIRCWNDESRGLSNAEKWTDDLVKKTMNPHEVLRWMKREHKFTYIGDAELDAIIWAVEDAIEKFPEVNLIVVATDSMCAKGWAERMF